MSTVGFARHYLRGQAPAIATMVGALILTIVFALVGPMLVSRVLSTVTTGDGAVGGLLIGAAVMALAQAAARAAATYASERVAWTATNELRIDLLANVLRLDVGYHHRRTAGEMIERIDGDASELNRFFSAFVVLLLGNLLLLVGILIALIVISPWVGVSVGAFCAVLLALMVHSRGLGSPQWQQDREQSSRYFGYLGEVVGAAEDIRALDAREYAMRGLYLRLRERLPIHLSATAWSCSVWLGSILLATGISVIAYGVAAGLFGAGKLTLAGVYLVVAYALMLAEPIEEIKAQVSYFQRAAASVTRVRGLLARRSVLAEGALDLPAGALPVRISGVRFVYPPAGDRGQAEEAEAAERRVAVDDTFALEIPTLHVQAGRVLAVVGPTGAGKSTLGRLLARYYDPQQGVVKVGGVDLRRARTESIRAAVRVVSQDVHIFAASLRDNLALFDDTIEDRHLVEVLSDLGLQRWLRAQPQGLDTPLNPSALSAGEAQLVALGRAFLDDPGLVVLDEPTSRIDPATDQFIRPAIARLLKGRTGVIIAHRVSTLALADDVVEIRCGRMTPLGPSSQVSAAMRTAVGGELLDEAMT